MNHVPSWSIVESDYIDDYIAMLRNLDGKGGGVDTPLQNLLVILYIYYYIYIVLYIYLLYCAEGKTYGPLDVWKGVKTTVKFQK